MSRVSAVLCTSGGAAGASVCARLLLCEQIEIKGIVQSSRILRPEYSSVRGAYEQIRLSGFRYSAYLWAATSLADLLLTISGRGSVAQLARRQRLPRLVTRDINGEREQSWLRRIRPDLLISAFFNQRIGTQVLASPRLGAVNIHPSLLPDYKGVDPVFFARLHGSASIGVTLHRIDQNLDTGHILAAEELTLPSTESVLAANLRLYRRGAELLTREIARIAEGAPGAPQTEPGRYDSWPTRAEVAELRRGGCALLRCRDLPALFASQPTRR